MKVLHVNISDRAGGAAIAGFRLHRAMREAGIDSRYFALNRSNPDDAYTSTASRFERYVIIVAYRLLERHLTKPMRRLAALFSPFRFGINIARRSEIEEADVIYLHWICGGLLNIRGLRAILKTGKPVFWFMHDMFPFTGGCHHAFDCVSYTKNCENCPYAGKRRSSASRQFKRKLKLYRKFGNLSFIAPSRWLCDCAKKSALAKGMRIEHIPNLIDTALFKPLDKGTARQLFGILPAKKYIGFGADAALTNPYKGWEYLAEALSILAKDQSLAGLEIELLFFGCSYDERIAAALPFKARFWGRLTDEYSMAMLYNAMDVFVIPSTAETFPNTVLESLACGTPVVGFDVGGIPEMVNEQTGYLAKYKNSADLARGIELVLNNPKPGARAEVMKYSGDKIVAAHKAMWERMKRLKIAYISDADTNDIHAWSGTIQFIAKALEKSGCDVYYIDKLANEWQIVIQRILGKLYYYIMRLFGMRFEPLRTVSATKRFARIIEKRILPDTDILFAPSTLTMAFVKSDRKKVIYIDATFAAMIDYYPSLTGLCHRTLRNGDIIEKRAFENCDMLLLSSDWAAQSAINDYGISPSKINVIPFGANIEADRTDDEILCIIENRATAMRLGKCNLLFVGVDWGRKGGNIALEIANLLHSRNIGVHLDIAGIKSIPVILPDYVTNHGFIDKYSESGRKKLATLFQEAHFFVLPTRQDCTPIVFSEAASFGLPSVTTNTGGVRTMVIDNINGFTFALSDHPENYADYIVRLLNNSGEYKNLCLSSFDDYKRRLNWSVAAESIRKSLENL